MKLWKDQFEIIVKLFSVWIHLWHNVIMFICNYGIPPSNKGSHEATFDLVLKFDKNKTA